MASAAVLKDHIFAQDFNKVVLTSNELKKFSNAALMSSCIEKYTLPLLELKVVAVTSRKNITDTSKLCAWYTSFTMLLLANNDLKLFYRFSAMSIGLKSGPLPETPSVCKIKWDMCNVFQKLWKLLFLSRTVLQRTISLELTRCKVEKVKNMCQNQKTIR